MSKKITKSSLIAQMYEEEFDENNRLEELADYKDFYALIERLHADGVITFNEMTICENAQYHMLHLMLEFIDKEPRIKVVFE